MLNQSVVARTITEMWNFLFLSSLIMTARVSAIPRTLNDDEIFLDCSVEEYYGNFQGETVSSWRRSEIAQLLRDTHRRVLPYTDSSREDVWDSLVDLDASDADGFVHLIYRDVDVPSLEYGTPSTWNREHLWPKSLGVGESGPDYTDIHALRPADWNVNSARGNLFFGDCELQCTSRPATSEAAPDTAKNGELFLPPASVRGDIARAMFYMELRYSFANEDFTSDLRLTDCPNDELTSEMAYLSELLAWHAEDPVDEQETLRNDRACSRWQGNRNVFVDFPELATLLHGEASPKPYRCEAPTPMPTASVGFSPTTEKFCATLSPGDVQVVGINSDNPDTVALVSLEDLPSGLELHITDKAWSGTEFLSNEGVRTLIVPSQGIQRGKVFGYGDELLDLSTLWEVDGSFALSTAGDSIIVYCQEGDFINHLGAFSIGEWSDNGIDYTTNESSLPQSLSQIGSIALPDFDNFIYDGITAGTKTELLEALSDIDNWSGSNFNRFTFSDRDSFQIFDSSTEPSVNSNLSPAFIHVFRTLTVGTALAFLW